MKLLFFLFLAVTFLNAFAIQPKQTKTLSQMNARLDSLYNNHEIYHKFFDQLKRDVAQENKRAIAHVVRYPLQHVMVNGKYFIIKNKQQFIHNYDAIFNFKVKQAVAAQQFVSIVANSDGLMIGNGEIWFYGVCLGKTCNQVKVCIITINN